MAGSLSHSEFSFLKKILTSYLSLSHWDIMYLKNYMNIIWFSVYAQTRCFLLSSACAGALEKSSPLGAGAQQAGGSASLQDWAAPAALGCCGPGALLVACGGNAAWHLMRRASVVWKEEWSDILQTQQSEAFFFLVCLMLGLCSSTQLFRLQSERRAVSLWWWYWFSRLKNVLSWVWILEDVEDSLHLRKCKMVIIRTFMS